MSLPFKWQTNAELPSILGFAFLRCKHQCSLMHEFFFLLFIDIAGLVSGNSIPTK